MFYDTVTGQPIPMTEEQKAAVEKKKKITKVRFTSEYRYSQICLKRSPRGKK
jgi:hypothetical protein